MSNYPTHAWYIACTADNLKKQAIACTINQIPLVIFRSHQQIIAFLDKCPHRNVPLSSGYLDRSLQKCDLICPYHGWRFDHNGICQHQPGQINQQNQPQYNLIKYPAIELYNHIWVYSHPCITPPTQPYQLPYINQPGFSTFSWKMTTQASVENIAENFLDATHTHFVHAKLIRSEIQRQEITVKITRNQQSVEAIYLGEQKISGLIYHLLAPGCNQVTSIGRFVLPSIAQLEYQTNRADYRLFISLFLTPIHEQLTQGYIFFTFRWGFANWLAKLIAQPLFLLAAKQDKQILELQSANLEKFGQEDFVMTSLDVMRPHILYLLKQSQSSFSSPEQKTDKSWQKTIKIMI